MIALDTNIPIYGFDKRDPERRSQALRLINNSTDGVLLWQVACEFVSASRKLASQGFRPADAWQELAHFLVLFPLVLPSKQVLDQARQLHLNSQWSYWDATLVAACLEAGVSRLYTEDLPGRFLPGLEIVNPFL